MKHPLRSPILLIGVLLILIGIVIVLVGIISTFKEGSHDQAVQSTYRIASTDAFSTPVVRPRPTAASRTRPTQAPKPVPRTRHSLREHLTGAGAWARSSAATRLRACEGGTDDPYRAVSATGKYRGAYQMDRSFWLTYGGDPGLTPDQAPAWMQDQVAYRGYLARGWEPWTCARILGFY